MGKPGKSFYLWNKMGLAKPARIFGTCTEMISPIISGKLTLVWSDWAWTKRSNVNWWSFFTVWNRRRKVIVTLSDVFTWFYRTCYSLPPKRKKVNNNVFACANVFICSVYWTLFKVTLRKSPMDEHLQLINVSRWLPRIGTISTQSPDLNPIVMVWHDLKKSVHDWKPSSVVERQELCRGVGQHPPQHCKRLIASYCTHFIAVVAAKGDPNF